MMNDTNTKSTTADEAQEQVRPQTLDAMIENEDWAGITAILKEEEVGLRQNNTTNTRLRRTNPRLDEIFDAFTEVDSDLLERLLEKRDNEEVKEMLLSLIKLGGKEFSFRKIYKFYNGIFSSDTLLGKACQARASIDVVLKIIELGGKEAVMTKHGNWNLLHWAIVRKTSVDVILKLIEVGGKELVVEKNNRHGNSLHLACHYNASIDIVSKLIEVGGKAFLMEKNIRGENPLHLACHYNASAEIVTKLIEVGGKALVAEKDYRGENSLQLVIPHLVERNDASSIEVLSKLIEVGGGKAFVMEKDSDGRNSLYFACSSNASAEMVSKLIEVGGKELVVEKDNSGRNSLHHACESVLVNIIFDGKSGTSTLLDETLLDLLIEHGGAELFTQSDNYGITPLQFFIANENDSKNQWQRGPEEKGRFYRRLVENATIMFNKGIELKVEGEYGIGGLFSSSSSQKVQDIIYRNWENIVLLALEEVIVPSNGQHLPILQSIIINNAPTHIIKSTAKCFAESVNTVDSSGRYPIDVAVRHGLAWDSGMKEILERTNADILDKKDISTGLSPFMVAALGGKKNGYDFDSVFHLIKSSPKLV